jgi:hypothetical protein
LNFGGAEPPRTFDEEPTVIVFDHNNYIANARRDLRPFHNIVIIINDGNALRNRLTNFNQSFTVASIHPQWYHHQTRGFVQQNLIIYDRVRSIYLFYIDVDVNNMRALFGNKINNCFPITSEIPAHLRQICSMTNDLNIAYCERQRVQNETQENIGVANLYARQKDDRLAIQLAYNELIRRQLEEQLLG